MRHLVDDSKARHAPLSIAVCGTLKASVHAHSCASARTSGSADTAAAACLRIVLSCYIARVQADITAVLLTCCTSGGPTGWTYLPAIQHLTAIDLH